MKRKCQECKKIKEVQTVIVGGWKAEVLGYKCEDCDPPRNTDNDVIITY